MSRVLAFAAGVSAGGVGYLAIRHNIWARAVDASRAIRDAQGEIPGSNLVQLVSQNAAGSSFTLPVKALPFLVVQVVPPRLPLPDVTDSVFAARRVVVAYWNAGVTYSRNSAVAAIQDNPTQRVSALVKQAVETVDKAVGQK